MRPSSILPLTLCLLGGLPAAGAQAAPHWGPPKQVVPAPADATVGVGAAEAITAPGGGLLAFGSDAANPIALRGSIAGGLTAAKITTASRGTAVGAVGADGTVAAAWADTERGRVAVAGADGSFGAPTDLPGAGTNALDVGVAGDGTTWLAWRTKAADGTYAVLAASIPKGGALGAPQTLISGRGAIGDVAVAAAPDGTVAVAFLRAIGRYRTQVAVRPAGAAAFESAKSVSAGQGDLAPEVTFEADGTIVAAWGNPAGGGYAQRRPGQAAFAPAASLGVPTYSVDLEPTTQGGSAIAFSSSADVRSAVRAAGADTFTPAAVAPTSGPIPASPEISVDAAGTPVVVLGNAEDGAVKAVVGQTTTTIGYGKPGTLIGTVTAAGRANEAIALWTDAQGGLSSATYGEDAPPATGPGPKPGAVDKIAPRLRLLSSKRITVSRRTTKLKLRFSCDEACRIGATAALRTVPKGKRRRIAPVTTLDLRKATLRPKGTRTVTLTLGRLALADLRRSLRAGRGAQLYLNATAADAARNERRLRAVLTLKAPTPKGRRTR